MDGHGHPQCIGSFLRFQGSIADDEEDLLHNVLICLCINVLIFS